MVRGGAPGRTRLGWERWARLGGGLCIGELKCTWVHFSVIVSII
jgi:hypothetical protein